MVAKWLVIKIQSSPKVQGAEKISPRRICLYASKKFLLQRSSWDEIWIFSREQREMNNMEQARFNMVEQQIRPWDVLDLQVLDLLSKVKREQFVPPASQEMTFMDVEIPLGHGAAMWPPKVEARALQALKLKPRDRVLEVGTGSGYLTALVSHLAEHVTSVEIVPELRAFAEKNLAAHHIENVTLRRAMRRRAGRANMTPSCWPVPCQSCRKLSRTA